MAEYLFSIISYLQEDMPIGIEEKRLRLSKVVPGFKLKPALGVRKKRANNARVVSEHKREKNTDWLERT